MEVGYYLMGKLYNDSIGPNNRIKAVIVIQNKDFKKVQVPKVSEVNLEIATMQ